MNAYQLPRYFRGGGKWNHSTFAALLLFQFVSSDGCFSLMFSYILMILRVSLSTLKKASQTQPQVICPWCGRTLWRNQNPMHCCSLPCTWPAILPRGTPATLQQWWHFGCSQQPSKFSVLFSYTCCAALAEVQNKNLCNPKTLIWSNGVHAQRCSYSLMMHYRG